MLIMLVLFDEALPGICHNDLVEMVLDIGIGVTCYYCKVNREAIDMNELSKWNYLTRDKVLLITDKPIINQSKAGVQVSYNGMVDAIGGKLAIVTVNTQSVRQWAYLALHEILHLYGLKHCERKKCIMAFRICNCELKYCIKCENPCGQISICDICRRKLNA